MGMNRNYSTISNLEPWFFPEFVLPFDAYKIKPWIIPIKLLLSNIYYENNISQKKNENNISQKKNENNISQKKNEKNISQKKNEKNISQKKNEKNISQKKNEKDISQKKNEKDSRPVASIK
ncbi:hypothetical protein GW17_00009430 [Ensete ventricosum]|nr:hypothetical protein GW17_00009430 [Ensete ventricosum]